MVVSGGDYVHFVVEYSGKLEKCRVTETALPEQGAREQKGRWLHPAHHYLCKAQGRDRTSCSREVVAGGSLFPRRCGDH